MVANFFGRLNVPMIYFLVPVRFFAVFLAGFIRFALAGVLVDRR